jgi:ribulose-5-phosphate 4-epimerase/fuculose-1-phosphate aldolase
MGNADMALLANHGVFVTGKTIRAVHQRAVALEQRCQHAWYVEAIGGGTPLAEPVQERFRHSDGDGFIGFFEAMARRELRRDPSILAGGPR